MNRNKTRPPVVEVRRRRSWAAPEAPRRASPDTRIRAWHDDKLQREDDAFHRKSKQEQREAAITEWCEWYRGVNYPEIKREVSAQQVARHTVDTGTWVQTIPGGDDPRWVIRPRRSKSGHVNRHHFNDTSKALEDLLPKASRDGAVNDPKFPTKSPWWAFIKDLRRKKP
jgi:hypothetical protein